MLIQEENTRETRKPLFVIFVLAQSVRIRCLVHQRPSA